MGKNIHRFNCFLATFCSCRWWLGHEVFNRSGGSDHRNLFFFLIYIDHVVFIFVTVGGEVFPQFAGESQALPADAAVVTKFPPVPLLVNPEVVLGLECFVTV